jgi:hypothetical protein
MTIGYPNGNRLPVPDQLDGRHFLYMPKPRELPQALIDTLVDSIEAVVATRVLRPCQVEIILPEQLDSQAARDAHEQLTHLIVDGLTCVKRARTEILVCQQTFPHADQGFKGTSFLSVVLHTGPYPYMHQTFDTELDEAGDQDVLPTSRLIRAGDWTVFDPTTPHIGLPIRPHQDNLLMMLQAELWDEDESDRREILSQLPPREGDTHVLYGSLK